MPQISSFLGIKIYMYYSEHYPAHFHAKYAEHQAEFDIETLGIIAGRLPRRVHALVVEWAVLHQEELYTNWEKARQGLSLDKIQPLE
jgi:hypothetical protein